MLERQGGRPSAACSRRPSPRCLRCGIATGRSCQPAVAPRARRGGAAKAAAPVVGCPCLL
eukprot:6124249-Heterocapsa_arctica.AAC.1